MAGRGWRELEPGVREVDLHGMVREAARRLVTDALAACRRDGTRVLRIVHGKGTSVLRDEVRYLLEGAGGLADYGFAKPRDGGDGVTVVRFRRGR